MSRHCVIWFALAVAVISSGCGGGNTPVAVKGIVTLDGKPVAGATVSFLPEGETGHPANGWTDKEGAFRLTTFVKGDGAFPGSYRVVVGKLEPKVPDGPTWTEYWDDAHDRRKKPVQYYGMLESTARKKSKSLLPTRYADVARTPLQCSVPSRGTVTLELRSKP